MYGLRTVVNRCGVISGPWQMGKVDQGFVVLWAARHLLAGGSRYMGFGGEGPQVRDVLHVADLYDLVRLQIGEISLLGGVYNVGGGRANSVSLAELTGCAASAPDATIPLDAEPHTSAADVPYYVTDNCARHRRNRLVASPSLSRRFSTTCSRGCASIARRSSRCWAVRPPRTAGTPTAR